MMDSYVEIAELNLKTNLERFLNEAWDLAVENETVVFIDNEYYGKCPKCHTQFDYTEKDYGWLVRCRGCHLLMRLKFKEKE